MPARKWTEEQRRIAAEAIQRWKPWRSSTGPKTDAGKARSARNAWKGGARKELRQLNAMVREFLKEQGDQ